jgi:hypothetical protein
MTGVRERTGVRASRRRSAYEPVAANCGENNVDSQLCIPESIPISCSLAAAYAEFLADARKPGIHSVGANPASHSPVALLFQREPVS